MVCSHLSQIVCAQFHPTIVVCYYYTHFKAATLNFDLQKQIPAACMIASDLTQFGATYEAKGDALTTQGVKNTYQTGTSHLPVGFKMLTGDFNRNIANLVPFFVCFSRCSLIFLMCMTYYSSCCKWTARFCCLPYSAGW